MPNVAWRNKVTDIAALLVDIGLTPGQYVRFEHIDNQLKRYQLVSAAGNINNGRAAFNNKTITADGVIIVAQTGADQGSSDPEDYIDYPLGINTTGTNVVANDLFWLQTGGTGTGQSQEAIAVGDAIGCGLNGRVGPTATVKPWQALTLTSGSAEDVTVWMPF